MDVVSHDNIKNNHLNPYGVHLSRTGTAIMARNYTDYFRILNHNWNADSIFPEAHSSLIIINESSLLSHTPNYPKLKGFRITRLNITSLLKYIEELKTYLADNQFEILSINETRLDTEIEDGNVDFPGYDIIRQDRNRSGGGVAIYVRDNIPYIKLDDLFGQGLEAICLEIKKAKCKPFLV